MASPRRKKDVVETPIVETLANRHTAPAVAIAEVGEAALEAIVAATNGEHGFLFTPASIHIPLLEAGLVEINEAITNDAGEVATRATTKGIASTMKNHAETPVEPVVKPSFEIKKGVVKPIAKRGGRTGEVYPFEQMEVGDCFFVAATEARPNPAKSLASTVSSATNRYAYKATDGSTRTNKKGEIVATTVKTRLFSIRSYVEDGVKGAMIWRDA